ncbi:MAG TPA: asparagine synthase-related protein [Vicinamibacterales bacterium]|nr:asparagine synthase-related protein [Vicinamibacterales bacterium]
MGCLVAILNADGAPIDVQLLRGLIDGPPYGDQNAMLVWTDGPVGLAFDPLGTPHRRREVVPSFTVNQRQWGVMDGRLDDRAALVRRLESRTGRHLGSACDVVLLLTAYEAWGEDCVQYLLGDFSFSVWDAERRRLFCARDHFGVKPLYYARVGASLIVSNVLRSVRRHPAVSERLDDEAMGDFFLFGACLEPARTSFADVARLPPAHTLTCSWPHGAPRVSPYWTLQPGDELRYQDPGEYVEHYSSTLATSVSDRLREDRVGILMSGGLDSSSVAVTAAKILGPATAPAAIRAYTAVYDTVPEDEERHYSTLVARSLGFEIEHHAVDRYQWFERWNQDLLPPEPSTEPMTAMMADLLARASRYGAVVLTGDGGDPLLLPSTVASQIGRVPLAPLAGDLWRSLWRVRALPPLGLRSALRRWLPRQPIGVPAWLADSFLRGFDAHARWKEIGARRAAADHTRGAAFSDIIDPWWTSMFETHDPGATQRPVEVRYPFFDVRLVSLALTLPSYPWCVDKEILRTALRGRLPEEVRTRPKSPLAGDPHTVHGRWTLRQATSAIEAAPAMASYVDVKKFLSTVRPEGLLTDAEPGTLAAVALATWLRCASATSVAA